MTSVEELLATFCTAPEGDTLETAELAAIRAALAKEITNESSARGRARRIVKHLRFVPLAAGCLVAVAIVGLAFVVRHRSPDRSLTGPAAGPSATALISRLAVLRRPQTAADRLPANLVVTPNGVGASGRGVIIPSLTRLVATRPNAKIFLVVTTPGRGRQALWKASQGDQVAIVAMTSRGTTQSDGYPAAELPDSNQLIRAGLLTGPGEPASTRAVALQQAYDVSIVPDGVTRVRWTFAARAGGPGGLVSSPVVNNVAVVQLRRATRFLLAATWYSSTGKVVPTSTKALDRALAGRQAIERRQALAQAEHQHATAPTKLLDTFAVFSFDSPMGTRTSDGYLIARPSLSELPLDLLSGFGRSPLDLRQARSVRAPSGLQMWVVPGPDGICVFEIDPPASRPYGRLGQSSGSSCSANLQAAIANGAGLDADNQHGAIEYGVVPRTHHNVKIRVSASTTRTIHPAAGVYITQTPFHFG